MAIIIPQEEPQSVNPPRIQPTADETTFGGGPGIESQNQGMQEIAKATNEIATFEKIRADQTAVQGALAPLTQKMSELMTDPKTGLPAYQGVNAMDGHDKVIAEYQKTANQLSAKLQPDQQGAFNREALQMGQHLNEYAMAHVNKQLEQHDSNTFSASVQNYTTLASNMYGNPNAVKDSADTIDKMAGARAKRLGLDPDETENFMRNIHSQFHESVLSQMVNDPNFQKQAEQYFADHKDEMDIDSQERVRKMLGDGSIKSQANTAVADLMSKHPNSESGFLAAADKIDDPDVRTMVRQIGSAQFQQNRAAIKNDQDETMNRVMDYVTKSGKTDPADIRQLIKTSDWNNMTGAQRTAVLKMGEDNVTSPKMWLDYTQSIKDGSIKSMSQADLQTKFLQYASLADQKTILKTWSDGQRGGKSGNTLAPTKTFHEMIDQAAVDAKIVPSNDKKSWEDNDIHNWKLLGDKVQEQMEAQEQTTGKKMTPAEQQKMINKIVIDHTFTDKGFFSDDVKFAPFGEIPEDFISNIRKEYPSATEDQITKSYSILKAGGKPTDARAVFKQ